MGTETAQGRPDWWPVIPASFGFAWGLRKVTSKTPKGCDIEAWVDSPDTPAVLLHPNWKIRIVNHGPGGSGNMHIDIGSEQGRNGYAQIVCNQPGTWRQWYAHPDKQPLTYREGDVLTATIRLAAAMQAPPEAHAERRDKSTPDLLDCDPVVFAGERRYWIGRGFAVRQLADGEAVPALPPLPEIPEAAETKPAAAPPVPDGPRPVTPPPPEPEAPADDLPPARKLIVSWRPRHLDRSPHLLQGHILERIERHPGSDASGNHRSCWTRAAAVCASGAGPICSRPGRSTSTACGSPRARRKSRTALWPT